MRGLVVREGALFTPRSTVLSDLEQAQLLDLLLEPVELELLVGHDTVQLLERAFLEGDALLEFDDSDAVVHAVEDNGPRRASRTKRQAVANMMAAKRRRPAAATPSRWTAWTPRPAPRSAPATNQGATPSSTLRSRA